MIVETPFEIQLQTLFSRDSRGKDPDQLFFFQILRRQVMYAMTRPDVPKIAYQTGKVSDIHQAPKDNPWNNSLIQGIELSSLAVISPHSETLSKVPDSENDITHDKIDELMIATSMYLDADPHASTVLVIPSLHLLSLHELSTNNLGQTVLISGNTKDSSVAVLAFNRGTSALAHLQAIRERL